MFSIRLVVSEPFSSCELPCTSSSSTSFLPTPALFWPNCQNAATNGDRGTSGFCLCLIHLCRCCPHCKALLWCVCLCVWVRFSLLLLGLRFSSTLSASDCRSILLLLPLCATAEKLSTFLAASCMCVCPTLAQQHASGHGLMCLVRKIAFGNLCATLNKFSLWQLERIAWFMFEI